MSSLLFFLLAAQPTSAYSPQTRWLVERVDEAAQHVASRGEASFSEFKVEGGPWRNKDFYIFILDKEGFMRVHPDATLEGRNTLDLKDLNDKAIIRGLLETVSNKDSGFYHYEWPVPGGILPRWKTTYVHRVRMPSGEEVVLGAGQYSDVMEAPFVTEMVNDALFELSQKGTAAFQTFRDRTSRFWAKDAYIFVINESGVDVVNPAFPNLEGRNLLGVKDASGKAFIKDMLRVVKTSNEGFVDYDWPRPQENVPSRKLAFVKKAVIDGKTYVVGSGMYLSKPQGARKAKRPMSSTDVITLVRAAATLLEKEGEKAYPQFRQRNSRWYFNSTYLFVWTLDGVRVFHAASPETEGQNVADLKDMLGRPIGQFILDAANSRTHEGWAHYLYPEPQSLFPVWKSTYVRRVVFPDGTPHLVGLGTYHMAMDKPLIESLVDEAAHLVETRGEAAFATFRDKKGPFYFNDTYVFVDTEEGFERVNPAQPAMEGRNLNALTDARGQKVQQSIVHAAQKPEGGWVTYFWYRPESHTPQEKHTFVRKVSSPDGTFLVGSGYYAPSP